MSYKEIDTYICIKLDDKIIILLGKNYVGQILIYHPYDYLICTHEHIAKYKDSFIKQLKNPKGILYYG